VLAEQTWEAGVDADVFEAEVLEAGVFEAEVRAQLEVIEAALLDAARARTPMVTDAAQHVIAAGGKRFRPLLVVLASHCGPDPLAEDVVKAAVVVELTHVASLYHDDVMDDARIRRGSPSANMRWGNTVAIMVGDFLFARASDIVSDLGPEFVRLQARTFARLVQGQIAETVGPGDADPLRHYLQVVADKTGSLIATSAMFGAKLAGADRDVQNALAMFGEEIGIVFQLSDDIIDITSDQSGKTPGTDLREGVPTLPILLARRSSNPADARLHELLDSDLSDDTALAEALDLLRRHPSVDLARVEVQRRATYARTLLAPLPPGPARTALEDLCDTVVTRTA
jgi:heptaprenyl diphosphate synthase